MKASSSAGTRRHAPALSFAATFGASAAAACVAEASTLPLDTAKVRLQLQTLSAGGSSIKYNGPIDVIRRMCAEEGWRSLYNGLTPGLHRQFLFTGIRLGLYDKVSAAVSGGSSGGEATGRTLSYPQKVAIALATSAVGITVANPSDVLKVRAQAHDPKNKVRRSRPRPTLENYVRVTRKEGFVSGLYKGYTANLVRNSIISCTEILSYDLAKSTLTGHRFGLEDAMPAHLCSGFFAGFAATSLGSPADVIGTKVMQKRGDYAGLTLSQAALRMAQREGLASFYKGFWPNFLRVGSFNVVMWLSYEWFKDAFKQH